MGRKGPQIRRVSQFQARDGKISLIYWIWNYTLRFDEKNPVSGRARINFRCARWFFSSKHSIKAERFYELNLMWFDEKNKALKSTSGPLSSTSGALTNTYIRFCSSTPRTTDAQWSLFSLNCRTFGLGQWSMHRPKQLDLLLICLMWTLPTFVRSNITDDFFLYCKFFVQTIMLKAQKECKPVIR